MKKIHIDETLVHIFHSDYRGKYSSFVMLCNRLNIAENEAPSLFVIDTWGTHGVHMGYTWGTHGVHMGYTFRQNH